MADRGFDAPGEIPFPVRCSDFQRDSPASSSSRPGCTATPAASSWRPTAPTPGRPRACPPTSCRTTTRARGSGTLRGLHFQTHPGQGKLVRCARGRVLDVVVDLRRGSPTFGEWEGFELDDESGHQLFIPVGFGHGFCVLSETADFVYKCTAYYDAATEKGIRFDDPDVGVRLAGRHRAPVLRPRPRRAPARGDRRRAPVPLPGMTAHDGRFAPSPTGTLHVGNLRTALLAWLVGPQRRRPLPRADGGPRPGAGAVRRGRAAAARPARDRPRLGRRGDLAVHARRGLRARDRTACATRATSTSASARAPRSARRAPPPTARCPRAPTRAPASSSPRPRSAASAPAAARRRCASAPAPRASGSPIGCTATSRASSTTSWSAATTARPPTTSRWSSTTPGRASARSSAATTCWRRPRASSSSPACSAWRRPRTPTSPSCSARTAPAWPSATAP